jgi:hypothetical protein
MGCRLSLDQSDSNPARGLVLSVNIYGCARQDCALSAASLNLQSSIYTKEAKETEHCAADISPIQYFLQQAGARRGEPLTHDAFIIVTATKEQYLPSREIKNRVSCSGLQ